jgi:hypothetical protein
MNRGEEIQLHRKVGGINLDKMTEDETKEL